MQLPENLDHRSRKRLVQLVCVAAWSDLDLADEERTHIMQLAADLALGADDMADVRSWLRSPPPDFDPMDVPRQHAPVFLEALAGVIAADGRIDPEECETLRLISELIQ